MKRQTIAKRCAALLLACAALGTSVAQGAVGSSAVAKSRHRRRSRNLPFAAANPAAARPASIRPAGYADGAADVVLGQRSFTSNELNAVGPATLATPFALLAEASGALWIADCGNNRVLRFPRAASTPDLVLGQTDFTSASLGASASRFNCPGGLALDGSGALWVADANNARVLRFSPPFSNGMSADRVLGQTDFVTDDPGTSPNSMSFVTAVAVDASSGVWVTDSSNNRLIHFSPPFTSGMNADRVLGQGDFVSAVAATSAGALGSPYGVAIDSSGAVWVADNDSNRVLRFSPPFSDGKDADLVLGQPNFTSSAGGTGAGAFSGPSLIGLDPVSGALWVADTGNNRVLRFSVLAAGATADLVLGQPDFTSTAGAVSSDSLDFPLAVVADPSGGAWIADEGNNRVLRFSAPLADGQAADGLLGQPDFNSNSFNAITAGAVSGLGGIFADASGKVWVADGNNRVLRFSPPFSDGMNADLVLGQPDFHSYAPGVSRAALSSPAVMAGDAGGHLWVADLNNSRVLRFSPPFADDMNADLVLGQADFRFQRDRRRGERDDHPVRGHRGRRGPGLGRGFRQQPRAPVQPAFGHRHERRPGSGRAGFQLDRRRDDDQHHERALPGRGRHRGRGLGHGVRQQPGAALLASFFERDERGLGLRTDELQLRLAGALRRRFLSAHLGHDGRRGPPLDGGFL